MKHNTPGHVFDVAQDAHFCAVVALIVSCVALAVSLFLFVLVMAVFQS